MAEILTDPVTGQRRSVEVRYDEPGGMGDINPQAVNQLFQTQKMEDAEKALSAAIQFQGLRGYQQALKSGEAAEKAMTRYGPMMFYQRPAAVGSAIRSVTPQVISPYQREVIDARKQSAARPQIRSIPGGGFVSINPTNQAITTVREPTLASPKVTPVVANDILHGPQRLPMTGEQFQSFIETAPPELRTNAVNSAINQMLKPATAAPGSATNEVIRKTKDGRSAVFNSETKQFIRYAN